MDLKVEKRTTLGKKLKALRNKGLIPAELYGHGLENVHLEVVAKEFSGAHKEVGESTIVNLVLEGKKIPALIHDTTSDFLSNKISHIDFYAVKMDEKIKTHVPFEFTGESAAVKQGGVLVKSMKEIEVEALPGDLPRDIEINLSILENLHDSIHVKDLMVSDKVKIYADAETVIVTVIEPAKEEEAAPVISVEDVKVEGEEKKKEKEEVDK